MAIIHSGDIVYVKRTGYRHFGIYTGDAQVIHYHKERNPLLSDGIIAETTLAEFRGSSDTIYVLNATPPAGTAIACGSTTASILPYGARPVSPSPPRPTTCSNACRCSCRPCPKTKKTDQSIDRSVFFVFRPVLFLRHGQIIMAFLTK